MYGCGFDLSTIRRTRRVGVCHASMNPQTSLSTSNPISVIAATFTGNVPIPSFLMYQGKYLMEDWNWLPNRTPVEKADVTK